MLPRPATLSARLQRAELIQPRGRSDRSSARVPSPADPRGRVREPAHEHAAESTAGSAAGSRSTAARSALPSWPATTSIAMTASEARATFAWPASAPSPERHARGVRLVHCGGRRLVDEPDPSGQMLEAAAQESTCSATPRATTDPEDAVRHLRVGRRRPRGRNARIGSDAISGCSAAGRGAAPDRPGHRGSRAWTEPGARDRVQLPGPEPDAGSRLRGRRVGAQGDRVGEAIGATAALVHALQQPRLASRGHGRPAGHRLPAPQPRPGDRAPPARRGRRAYVNLAIAGPPHLPDAPTTSRTAPRRGARVRPPHHPLMGSSTAGSAPPGRVPPAHRPLDGSRAKFSLGLDADANPEAYWRRRYSSACAACFSAYRGRHDEQPRP